MGLTEISSLSETHDYADAAQFQPELRTSTALHPDTEHIPVTRANGILTTFVEPTGGLISGQGCVIDLNGWVPRELVIADSAALNVRIPAFIVRNPDRRPFGPPGRPPGQGPAAGGGDQADPNARRKDQLDKIKQIFRKAIAYDDVLLGARQRGESPPAPDPRLEALVPYARGKKLVILHADQRVEILDALELARELKLKAAISGAGEAWKVVEAIQKAKVPVLLTGTLRLPRREHDPYDAVYAAPAKLHAAGVEFAIRSQSGPDGPSEATATRNLPFEAAAAVAFGLPEDVALRSVTMAPARILGIADQVGSIEPGRRANLVITAGHILQPTTTVLSLFIDGQPVRPESRHTQLYAKYRRRLNEVRAGRRGWGSNPSRAMTSLVSDPIGGRSPSPERQREGASGEGSSSRGSAPSPHPPSGHLLPGGEKGKGDPSTEGIERGGGEGGRPRPDGERRSARALPTPSHEVSNHLRCRAPRRRGPRIGRLSGLVGRSRRARIGERSMAEVGFEDPAELIGVMGPADVFPDSHAIEHRRLIDAISVGDHQHGHLACQDRGCPEQPVEVFQVSTVVGPVHHDQSGMGHGQQRTSFVNRRGDNHPAGTGDLIVDLVAQETEEWFVARNREDGAIGHDGNTPCGERANPCILTGTTKARTSQPMGLGRTGSAQPQADRKRQRARPQLMAASAAISGPYPLLASRTTGTANDTFIIQSLSVLENPTRKIWGRPCAKSPRSIELHKKKNLKDA